jgi:hypothetical protein
MQKSGKKHDKWFVGFTDRSPQSESGASAMDINRVKKENDILTCFSCTIQFGEERGPYGSRSYRKKF